MPTGYTAGIVDGKITDFKQFAILCMRAFGATIHMRDEPMELPYEPRVPSDYHQENIKKANDLLALAQTLTDSEIVAKRKQELEESKSYQVKGIERANKNREILNSILKDAENYKPPTNDHIEIKHFMIEQIKETIKWDADSKYNIEKLAEINEELKSLNPAVIRSQMIAKAEQDLQYHTEELSKEIKRCEDSNRWVEVFLNSLANGKTL